MNRRDLLRGIAATLTVAACPTIVEAAVEALPETNWVTWFDQWQRDALDVLVQVWEDILLYGNGAYEHTNVYPYVRRIDPATLPPPAIRGGLF